MSRKLCRPVSCAKPKGHELRPAAHDAQPLTSLVLAGLGFEFMSRKEPEKLHEDCVMMSHGLDLLSFE